MTIERWWCELDELTKELIQVAAALAAGCASCLEQHVPKAGELGASDADLQEVLLLVRPVKLAATMKIDELAENLFVQKRTLLNVVSQGSGSGCGCGSGNCCS
ncbi:MAG: carboxymuconolactone decarboxylase family protein [Bacilli bacterium]